MSATKPARTGAPAPATYPEPLLQPWSDAEHDAFLRDMYSNVWHRSYGTVDVAALMGISSIAVYFRMRRGTLPFAGFRIGNAWRFAKHDVHAWISEQEKSAA